MQMCHDDNNGDINAGRVQQQLVTYILDLEATRPGPLVYFGQLSNTCYYVGIKIGRYAVNLAGQRECQKAMTL